MTMLGIRNILQNNAYTLLIIWMGRALDVRLLTPINATYFHNYSILSPKIDFFNGLCKKIPIWKVRVQKMRAPSFCSHPLRNFVENRQKSSKISISLFGKRSSRTLSSLQAGFRSTGCLVAEKSWFSDGGLRGLIRVKIVRIFMLHLIYKILCVWLCIYFWSHNIKIVTTYK